MCDLEATNDVNSGLAIGLRMLQNKCMSCATNLDNSRDVARKTPADSISEEFQPM